MRLIPCEESLLQVKCFAQVNSLLRIHPGGREGDVALTIALFAVWGSKDRYNTGAAGIDSKVPRLGLCGKRKCGVDLKQEHEHCADDFKIRADEDGGGSLRSCCLWHGQGFALVRIDSKIM